jgi:proteasome lid subunit RPN8/RPN11
MTRPAPLTIPTAIVHQLYRLAREAYPRECCGWLAGPRASPDLTSTVISCSNAQPAGAHPPATSAYRFAGPDLVAFTRSADGELPARVIFHSHPNGCAELSSVDIDSALSPWRTPLYPVQHLVVAIDAHRVSGAGLFAWCRARERFVRVAEFAGADL